MVRLFLAETRNVDRLMLQRSARAVARSSITLLMSELRMVVPEGGILAASPSSVELFAPFASGLSCGTVGQSTIVSLLPADSAMLASALYSGYAWRGNDGRYAFVDTAIALSWGASASPCAAAGLTTLSGGQLVAVSPPLPASATAGTPIFLVQRLRYWFGPSADMPGAVALLRTRALDAGTEELAAPVDSVSHFRFFREGVDSSESMPPAVLDDLRGLELNLVGLSSRRRFGASRPERAARRSAIYFANATPW